MHVYARLSERAHARITRLDVTPCYQFPGVAIALTAADVPGQLDIGPVVAGDPLLADGRWSMSDRWSWRSPPTA